MVASERRRERAGTLAMTPRYPNVCNVCNAVTNAMIPLHLHPVPFTWGEIEPFAEGQPGACAPIKY